MHPKTLRLSMLVAAFAVASLAGCIGGEEGPPAATESPQSEGATDEETEPHARAVVADIGPGTNPYHDAERFMETFRDFRETLYPWPSTSGS